MERIEQEAALHMDYEGRGCAGEPAPPPSGWIEIDREGNQIPIPGRENRVNIYPKIQLEPGSAVVFELDLNTLEFVPVKKE